MPGRGKGSGQKSTWKTSLTDTPATDEEGVGQIREEHGPHGYRRFIWARVVQTSGCSAGDAMMYALNWGGITVSIVDGINSQLTVITGGGNVSFVTSSTVTDASINAYVDDWIMIVSTVVAGNAPEAEVRKIRSNTSNKFFVATDFSVAPSVLDTFNIIRPGGVVDAVTAGIAAGSNRVAGIAMADADRNDYLWLQTTGLNFACKVETAAIGRGGPAIIGFGGAEIGSTLIADSLSLKVLQAQQLGFVVGSVQSGLASRLAPVYLEINN